MARPRKIKTDQMIDIVDSYYLTCCGGNEKLMKCSLIAEYATELGFAAEGYDFARNVEVREHIERLKVHAEFYGKYHDHLSVYKSLDVDGFIRNNSGEKRLAEALRELDVYWQRTYEYTEQTADQNRMLRKDKVELEGELLKMKAELEPLKSENTKLRRQNVKLSTENRYLRKMLRTYLYPAVADEILKAENDPPQTDTEVTDAAVCDFIEDGIPKTFESSVSKDNRIQSEAEHFMERLWEKCDE